jgi:SNF2 family DNA or RNA helicase
MATTLTLVQEILARQEQVVVFSAFNDPLDNLGRWLDEASVRYIKLDGRVSQKQRGKLAAQFKRGRVSPPRKAPPPFR